MLFAACCLGLLLDVDWPFGFLSLIILGPGLLALALNWILLAAFLFNIFFEILLLTGHRLLFAGLNLRYRRFLGLLDTSKNPRDLSAQAV